MTAVTGIQKEEPKLDSSVSNSVSGDGNSADGDNSTESPVEVMDGHPNDSSKVRPGVAFWIAIQTHECMLRKLEGMFVNMFLACGFSVYHCKVCHFTPIFRAYVSRPIHPLPY